MKLFLTVGAQMPFDRLVSAVDAWAQKHPQDEVFAQVGDSDISPEFIRAERFLAPPAFARACADADAIIGHAGTGTIFSAIEHQKPLVILPRRASRRETRNDHQVATARAFDGRRGLFVAWETDELPNRLEALRRGLEDGIAPSSPDHQETPLLRTIRDFIEPSARPGR